MNELYFDDIETYNLLESTIKEVCGSEIATSIFDRDIQVLPQDRNSISLEETPCVWFNIVSNSPYEGSITDNQIENHSSFSVQIEIYVSEQDGYAKAVKLKNIIKQALQSKYNIIFNGDTEASSYVDSVRRRLLIGRGFVDNKNKIFYSK